MSRFDIVIFGASGYTGKYVVEHVAKIAEAENITWAVAGRSQAKLEETLKFVNAVSGIDLNKVECIVASIGDEDSLNNMCKRARCVINCVGPYRLWGEQVVRAAIANGAHHLDISGEPIYLEGTQVKYNEDAKKANVYVVGSVGGDSIPSEMGIEFLTANCDTDINSINTFLTFKGGRGAGNYGTWHSAVRGISDAKKLGPIRRELFQPRLPTPKFKLERKNIFYNENLQRWSVVLPATDRSVAKRTQHYHYSVDKKQPIQVETYLVAQNMVMVAGLVLIGIVFVVLSSFEYGRKLMLEYPEYTSLGVFAKEGAPRDVVVKRRFELVFEGEAFDSALEDPDAKHDKAPTRKVSCKVSGPDFGYVGCSIFIVQSALTLLKESDKLPGPGVYTPGAAFSKSGLISRLQKNGINFEMLS